MIIYQYGPVSVDELKRLWDEVLYKLIIYPQNSINETTYVWSSLLGKEWIAICNISELHALLSFGLSEVMNSLISDLIAQDNEVVFRDEANGFSGKDGVSVKNQKQGGIMATYVINRQPKRSIQQQVQFRWISDERACNSEKSFGKNVFYPTISGRT